MIRGAMLHSDFARAALRSMPRPIRAMPPRCSACCVEKGARQESDNRTPAPDANLMFPRFLAERRRRSCRALQIVRGASKPAPRSAQAAGKRDVKRAVAAWYRAAAARCAVSSC